MSAFEAIALTLFVMVCGVLISEGLLSLRRDAETRRKGKKQ